MRNVIIFIVLLFASVGIAGSPNKELHTKCLYPSIQIALGDIAIGTGIVVRSEKVHDEFHNVAITCAHVLRHRPTSVLITTYENWSTIKEKFKRPMYIYDLNDDQDLGIVLFTTTEEMRTAEFNFNPQLFIGNEVLKIGGGINDDLRLDLGKITSLPNVKIDQYRTSLFTVQGDSGGPVFHEYKLIGILRSVKMLQMSNGTTQNLQISYVIPITNLKKWDKSIDNTLGFVYDLDKELPKLPYFRLKLASMEVNRKFIPETYWNK